MRPPSRRWLWTAALLLAALVGGAVWLVRSPGTAPGGEDTATRRGAPPGDAPGRAAADPEGAAPDLPAADFGDDADLGGAFEPPTGRQVHRWELLRDGRAAGSFRAEVAPGQEGMVELSFRVRTPSGTDRGSVTTVPRLLYRYARLAVEAEGGSRLPLLTVLSPPALRAVLATLEEAEASGEGGAVDRGDGPAETGGDERSPEGPTGEPVDVDGTSARRFTATAPDGTRVETLVVPGRLLPLRVRTTLPDGTVLEARPPGGSSWGAQGAAPRPGSRS